MADGEPLLSVGAPGPIEANIGDDDELDAPEAVDGATPAGDLDGPAGPIAADEVCDLLEGLGDVAHVLVGDDDVEDHWKFDDDELDSLTPPLTRIINRRPPLQKMVRRGDGFLVVLHLTGYASRNVDDLREARKARGELDREGERGARRDRAAPPWMAGRGNGDRVEAGGGGPGGDAPGDPQARRPLG